MTQLSLTHAIGTQDKWRGDCNTIIKCDEAIKIEIANHATRKLIPNIGLGTRILKFPIRLYVASIKQQTPPTIINEQGQKPNTFHDTTIIDELNHLRTRFSQASTFMLDSLHE